MATEAAAAPAELAAEVVEAPKATSGAAQPIKLVRQAMPRVRLKQNKKADRPQGFDLLGGEFKEIGLFRLADNIEHTSCPRFTYNRLKLAIWSFVI